MSYKIKHSVCGWRKFTSDIFSTLAEARKSATLYNRPRIYKFNKKGEQVGKGISARA